MYGMTDADPLMIENQPRHQLLASCQVVELDGILRAACDACLDDRSSCSE
jgi:hypothetical protein